MRAPWLRLRGLLSGRLLRDSGIYVGATLLNAAIPFLLMPPLTRALGPEQYGVIGTFTALVSFAVVLVGLGTHGLISVKYFKVDQDEFARSVSACVAIIVIAAAALAMLLPIMASRIEDISGIQPSWQWAVVVAAVSQAFTTLALAILQAQGRAMRFGALQLTVSISTIGITLWLVLGIGKGWEARAMAAMLVGALVTLATIRSLWREGIIRAGPSVAHMREALAFGAPLVPHLLGWAVIASNDRLVLTDLIGSREAGLYFAAYQIASALVLVATSVNQAVAPWMYRCLSSGTYLDKRKVVRVTYLLLVLMVLGVTIMIFLGPWLLLLLAGSAFAPAAPYLPFLAIAAGCTGGYYLFVNYIFYVERTAVLPFLTIGMAIVQVGLTIGLVRQVGAIGAAMSAAVAAGLYLAATMFVAQRLHPMPWLSSLRP